MRVLVRSLVLLLFFILVLALSTYSYGKDPKPAINKVQPIFDVTVSNTAEDWVANTIAGKNPPEKVPFIKIKSVSLGTDKENLFVKFQLGGVLPLPDQLPSYSGDKIIGATYYLDIEDSYFDAAGNKNPADFSTNLKIVLYGEGEVNNPPNKITVDGEMVEGGYGFDYFVVKYPYRSIFMHEENPSLVFKAESVARSKNWSTGLSGFKLHNAALAATKDDDSEIRINLNIKKQ